MLVILEVFSHAEINGCYLRNVLAEYPTSWIYSRLEKQTHSTFNQDVCFLAFLEPVDVGEEFVLIHSQAPNNEKLELCFGPMVGEP